MRAPTDPFTLAAHLVDDHDCDPNVGELDSDAMRELHRELHRAPWAVINHDHPDL